MTKTAKSVLAANPLDAVLGFGAVLDRPRKGRGAEASEPVPPSKEEAAPPSERDTRAPASSANAKVAAMEPRAVPAAEPDAAREQEKAKPAQAVVSRMPALVQDEVDASLQRSAHPRALQSLTASAPDRQPESVAPSVSSVPGSKDSEATPAAAPRNRDHSVPARENTRALERPPARNTPPELRAATTEKSSTPRGDRTAHKSVALQTESTTPSLNDDAQPSWAEPGVAESRALTANDEVGIAFDESATGTVPAPQTSTRRGSRNQAPEEEPAGRGASFRHRIGTIQEPYVRADGTKVRQWSITLPHDLIRRVTHLAVDRGVKPAVLVQEALERFFSDELG
jgi:hypothetical protein